jgi:hypothetical protein
MGECGGRKWGGLEVGFEEPSDGVFDVVTVRSGEPRKADVNGDVVRRGVCRARSAGAFEVEGIAVCLGGKAIGSGKVRGEGLET